MDCGVPSGQEQSFNDYCNSIREDCREEAVRRIKKHLAELRGSGLTPFQKVVVKEICEDLDNL